MCRCWAGFDGVDCAIPVYREFLEGRYCPNNCSGNGVCTGTWCKCKRGWFGRDCGRSKAYTAGSAEPSPYRLRIYMYELPWRVASFIDQTGWVFGDVIYFAHEKFFKNIAADWSVRTENPYEADLFYVPALAYQYSGNLGQDQIVMAAQRSVSYLQAHSPFWARHGGKDHFMWSTIDRGTCGFTNRSTPEGAPIMVTLFGHYAPSGSGLPRFGREPNYDCFHPLKDVVAAPYHPGFANSAAAVYDYDAAFAAGVDASNSGEHPQFRISKRAYKRELIFAGGIRLQEPDYSGGVRQALFNLFGDGHDPQVLVHEGHIDHYHELLESSRFCLTPSGHGWGMRIAFAAAANCVPLIIQDGVFQPYEDLLPYETFSVRLQLSDIPNIVRILKQVTPEEHLAMRRALARIHTSFGWDEHGTAYNATIASLHRRYKRLKATLFKKL